jgi:hypothetical protein
MEASGAPLPPVAASVQPRRKLRWTLVGGLLLLIAGMAAGGWVMQFWLAQRGAAPSMATLATNAMPGAGRLIDMASAPSAAAPRAAPPPTAAPADLAARLAMVEARLAEINAETSSLNGNAARAEALLIAFAVRRALDRGLALGTLESQLRLRFGDAQPNAVRTVIEAATQPMTLDRLQGDFDALVPMLSGQTGADAGFWTAARRELGSLFVLRSAGAPSTRVEARVEQARRWLAAGMVDRAAGEVAALPGAAAAQDWLVAARRYHDARRALDLIETAAILAPREPAPAAAPPAVAARPQNR